MLRTVAIGERKEGQSDLVLLCGFEVVLVGSAVVEEV
jgi:hypothetical protein